MKWLGVEIGILAPLISEPDCSSRTESEVRYLRITNRLDLSDESHNYMDSCARIRKISRTRLMERLLNTIFDDQLVLGILDDDSKANRQLANERTKSHFYPRDHK